MDNNENVKHFVESFVKFDENVKAAQEYIKETYNINNQDIANTPSIMIFKDGNLYSIYNIKDNNYNINNLVDYLEEEDIIND